MIELIVFADRAHALIAAGSFDTPKPGFPDA
jgi:hypothetical protein